MKSRRADYTASKLLTRNEALGRNVAKLPETEPTSTKLKGLFSVALSRCCWVELCDKDSILLRGWYNVAHQWTTIILS
jgi:hypothetical protein